MNVVYKLTFNKRKMQNIVPYLYIGSKSGCSVHENEIVDSSGKPYYGSSTYMDYNNIVKSDDISIEILDIIDGEYKDLLLCEKHHQLKNDVVASPEYFNKSIASINTYSDPEYATFKHIQSNKIVRLPRNHALVLCGDYVGVTSGTKQSADLKKKKSVAMMGDKNPFYGKKHSNEVIENIISKNTGRKLSDDTKSKMSDQRRGVPKTEEHKLKIGRPNMISLKNIHTGECIRILKIDYVNYDKGVWINSYSYKLKFTDIPEAICSVCGKKGKDNSSFKRWHNNNCRGLKNENNSN